MKDVGEWEGCRWRMWAGGRDVVSSPDLIWRVYRLQYNTILKVICAGVGFGSGTETSRDAGGGCRRGCMWRTWEEGWMGGGACDCGEVFACHPPPPPPTLSLLRDDQEDRQVELIATKQGYSVPKMKRRYTTGSFKS